MHIVWKGNVQNNTKDDVEIHAFSFANFVYERSLSLSKKLELDNLCILPHTLEIDLATSNGRRRDCVFGALRAYFVYIFHWICLHLLNRLLLLNLNGTCFRSLCTANGKVIGPIQWEKFLFERKKSSARCEHFRVDSFASLPLSLSFSLSHFSRKALGALVVGSTIKLDIESTKLVSFENLREANAHMAQVRHFMQILMQNRRPTNRNQCLTLCRRTSFIITAAS